MSAGDTGLRQRERLGELGLRVALLPALRDVDTMEDARAVAASAPARRFAAALVHVEAAVPSLEARLQQAITARDWGLVARLSAELADQNRQPPG